MKVITQKFIFRSDLKANPSVLYVFGDNLERRGMGGQAKEMRGEPNAVGVATKRTPTSGTNAYFSDDDFDEIRQSIVNDFVPVMEHLSTGGVVVIPEDGLGTGLSELPTRAPRIDAYLKSVIQALLDLSNGEMRKFFASDFFVDRTKRDV